MKTQYKEKFSKSREREAIDTWEKTDHQTDRATKDTLHVIVKNTKWTEQRKYIEGHKKEEPSYKGRPIRMITDFFFF